MGTVHADNQKNVIGPIFSRRLGRQARQKQIDPGQTREGSSGRAFAAISRAPTVKVPVAGGGPVCAVSTIRGRRQTSPTSTLPSHSTVHRVGLTPQQLSLVVSRLRAADSGGFSFKPRAGAGGGHPRRGAALTVAPRRASPYPRLLAVRNRVPRIRIREVSRGSPRA
jgi:hypothetical protein